MKTYLRSIWMVLAWMTIGAICLAADKASSPKASKDKTPREGIEIPQYQLPDKVVALCDSCEKGYMLKPIGQRPCGGRDTATNRIVNIEVKVKCPKKHIFKVQFEKKLPPLPKSDAHRP